MQESDVIALAELARDLHRELSRYVLAEAAKQEPASPARETGSTTDLAGTRNDGRCSECA